MSVARIKGLAAVTGLAAFAVALAVNLGATTTNVAGGSGASSTAGAYKSPVVPAMSVDPTAMNLGATATDGPAQTTLATPMASPAVKAAH